MPGALPYCTTSRPAASFAPNTPPQNRSAAAASSPDHPPDICLSSSTATSTSTIPAVPAVPAVLTPCGTAARWLGGPCHAAWPGLSTCSQAYSGYGYIATELVAPGLSTCSQQPPVKKLSKKGYLKKSHFEKKIGPGTGSFFKIHPAAMEKQACSGYAYSATEVVAPGDWLA